MIIFFKNNVVILAEKLRNRRNKKEKIKRDAKLSNIETSLKIVIHYCNSTL